MAHIEKILVPSDGSPPSLAALHEASMIAEDLGASVDVLYVRPETGSAVMAVPSTDEHLARELDRAIAAEQNKLGARLVRRTEEGDPLRTILELATRGDYDLIVMGTHARVGRLHALIGSVAEGVVRSAPCPVLTVREASGQESFAERRHRRKSVAEQTR